MPTRKSKRDAQCEHCKRFFTKKGLKEHQRHVKCSPTSTATPRKWERARCKHCGKSFHSSNSLRVHVSTQHPTEYRKSPNSVKAHRSPVKRSGSTKTGRASSAPRHDTAGPLAVLCLRWYSDPQLPGTPRVLRETLEARCCSPLMQAMYPANEMGLYPISSRCL